MSETREELLKNVWDQTISNMSVERAKEVLKQMGLPKTMYQRLGQTNAQKVLLGILSRLDNETLEVALPMLSEQA